MIHLDEKRNIILPGFDLFDLLNNWAGADFPYEHFDEEVDVKGR